MLSGPTSPNAVQVKETNVGLVRRFVSRGEYSWLYSTLCAMFPCSCPPTVLFLFNTTSPLTLTAFFCFLQHCCYPGGATAGQQNYCIGGCVVSSNLGSSVCCCQYAGATPPAGPHRVGGCSVPHHALLNLPLALLLKHKGSMVER